MVFITLICIGNMFACDPQLIIIIQSTSEALYMHSDEMLYMMISLLFCKTSRSFQYFSFSIYEKCLTYIKNICIINKQLNFLKHTGQFFTFITILIM